MASPEDPQLGGRPVSTADRDRCPAPNTLRLQHRCEKDGGGRFAIRRLGTAKYMLALSQDSLLLLAAPAQSEVFVTVLWL